MSRTVFLKQVDGGFIVEDLTHATAESVHTDLPCALAAVSDLLQPPDDKPELDERYRRFLQSLLDKKGAIVKVGGKWRWLALAPHDGGVDLGRMKAATGTYEEDINAMIDLGLLYNNTPMHNSGMKLYAYVSNTGIEALKR